MTSNNSSNMYPPREEPEPMTMDYLPFDIKIPDGNQSVPRALDKPTRPLTAYHLFFQLEREFIIQTTKSDENDNNQIDSRPVGLQLDSQMPLRYRNVHLNSNWYATGKEKRGGGDQKRRHRKTHGKIAFLDLSKTIASRWATLEETDPETKNYCTIVAKRELDVYREKVKLYKASLSDAPLRSLPGSFSSASSTSSSPTLNMSPASARASFSETAPQLATLASMNPFIRSNASGLTMSANNATSFQISSDFHPEFLDQAEITCERPTKWARSSLPSTMDGMSSNMALDLGWSNKWTGNQKDIPVPQAAFEGAMTNPNSSEMSIRKESGSPMDTETKHTMGEFTFHPVPCESEDTFLKKYRKLARRTSLFSIRPLHNQVVPLNQPIIADAAKSNINPNDMMEAKKPVPRQGFRSIQQKLRNELNERVSQVFKGKGQAEKKLSKKRLSSTISEMDSEPQIEFTSNDAQMLMNALMDDKISDEMDL